MKNQKNTNGIDSKNDDTEKVKKRDSSRDKTHQATTNDYLLPNSSEKNKIRSKSSQGNSLFEKRDSILKPQDSNHSNRASIHIRGSVSSNSKIHFADVPETKSRFLRE